MPIYFSNKQKKTMLFSHLNMRKWLNRVAKEEGFIILELNYVFVSDAELLSINNQFLQHDFYTDIITFDNATENQKNEKHVVSDIFISLDRVKENAITFKQEFTNELMRVMVHGLLHLLGYKDKNGKQEKEMRNKETYYIKTNSLNI